MTGCYILYSQKLAKYYVGATQEDVLSRIEKHNNHMYGEHRFTAATNDWQLFLFIASDDYAHAVRIERHIKKMKSKVYINNLKKYPELAEKLTLLEKSN
jgi:putative endonuclease